MWPLEKPWPNIFVVWMYETKKRDRFPQYDDDDIQYSYFVGVSRDM